MLHRDCFSRQNWTLPDLYTYLVEYLYVVYDQNEHSSLGMPPQAAYLWGMRQGGEREHVRVAYNDRFLKETCPTTAKGTAVVQKGSRIKVNHFYYWNNAFRSWEVVKIAVPIRFDPLSPVPTSVLVIEADQPDRSVFDRGDYYRTALTLMGEPTYQQHLHMDIHGNAEPVKRRPLRGKAAESNDLPELKAATKEAMPRHEIPHQLFLIVYCQSLHFSGEHPTLLRGRADSPEKLAHRRMVVRMTRGKLELTPKRHKPACVCQMIWRDSVSDSLFARSLSFAPGYWAEAPPLAGVRRRSAGALHGVCKNQERQRFRQRSPQWMVRRKVSPRRGGQAGRVARCMQEH